MKYCENYQNGTQRHEVSEQMLLENTFFFFKFQICDLLQTELPSVFIENEDNSLIYLHSYSFIQQKFTKHVPNGTPCADVGNTGQDLVLIFQEVRVSLMDMHI